MTVTPRRRLDAPGRRETIIVAATRIFATAGYERARMSDVAARIGVTEPVVYQNFGTKAGLFAAVMARAADQLAEQLETLAGDGDDVLELLSRFLSADHLDRLHRGGGIGVLFAEAASPEAPADAREAAHAAIARLVGALAGVIRRGQAEGSLRDDVPAEAQAWVVFSAIHAWGFRRRNAKLAAELEGELLAAALNPLRKSEPA